MLPGTGASLFGLGLWFSSALPFLFMFASLTFALWQRRQ